jgi:hypothetical protein
MRIAVSSSLKSTAGTRMKTTTNHGFAEHTTVPEVIQVEWYYFTSDLVEFRTDYLKSEKSPFLKR